MPGLSCLLLKHGGRVSPCVSDGKREPALGALWLGLVAFVSPVCQRQVILVRFPSKQQTDTHPFELLEFAKKTV